MEPPKNKTDQLFLKLTKKNDSVKNGVLLEKMMRHEDVNLKDYDVGYTSDFMHLLFDHREEVFEYIAEHGFSSLLALEPLNEEIIKRGTAQPTIIDILKRYLTKIDVDNELIITDPYFYASTRIPNYADIIAAIVQDVLPSIDVLHIITTANTRNIDTALKTAVESKLTALKPSIHILHRTSWDVHDRYWISHKREKGFITGSSINGLGFKLALVDRLNTSDVRQIVQELIALGVL